MPFPADVVVDGLAVVVTGVPPMTPTQTLTSAHKPEQSLFTEGFHFAKSARLIC
jgi:hypothetical protein